MKMKGYNDIAGIVLAGGAGSRLGEDKCCIRFSFAAGERTLLEHSLKLLLSVLPEVHIIGRECEGKSWFPDGIPDKGPVGGIATALKLLAKPCLVLPVDLPFMNGRLLRALLDARMLRRPEDVVTCFRHEISGRIQPVPAIFENFFLPVLEKGISEDKVRLDRLIPINHVHGISYSTEEALPFFSINHPADVRAAQLILATSPV